MCDLGTLFSPHSVFFRQNNVTTDHLSGLFSFLPSAVFSVYNIVVYNSSTKNYLIIDN